MIDIQLPLALRVLALKFDLNEYTSWWNSPQAALYFWSGFILMVVLIAGGVMLWLSRERAK
jgi:hypothetical protein